MKLAIAIASEKAAPSAFVVWRGFGPAIEKAKRAGFQGVELALRSEREFESEGLAEILQRNKMSARGRSLPPTGSISPMRTRRSESERWRSSRA